MGDAVRAALPADERRTSAEAPSAIPQFRSVSHPLRIFAGTDALDSLPRELDRLGVRRAFVLCGDSVATRTDLLSRVRELGGDRIIAVDSGISEGAPRAVVEAAARAVMSHRGDALVAIGAGSVTKAARVIAMLVGEGVPLDEMATYYPEDQAAVSPRLNVPKLPIINIVTAPTTSQNRSGAAIRDETSGHILEFFDPKTRPHLLYWDAAALLTAPPSLIQSTGLWVYWRALMNMGLIPPSNPLVAADRREAFKLAENAIPRLSDETDAQARIDLCAVALLQVRDEDDGGRPMSAHLIVRTAYILAVALFNSPARVNQTRAGLALTGSVIRTFGSICPDTIAQLNTALGRDWSGGDPEDEAERLAADIDGRFERWGFPPHLHDQGISSDDTWSVVDRALRNFNGNNDGALNKYREQLHEALLRVL